MRPYFCRLVLLLAALALPARLGAEEKRQALCYVIPIHKMIERGLVYVVRRGVSEAVTRNADAIVFEMDTPGGRLDAAEEIIRTLGGIKIKTCTFVNPESISAGAIIAMATDQIYMSPGSRIGDAMPIMVSMFGGVEQMSEALEEKSVAYVSSVMRSNAERHGHDPKLAEAMVRRQIGFKVGDHVFAKEGQLLALTNGEAERLVERDGKQTPLLSLGTVASIEEVCAKMGIPGARLVRVEVSLAERVARWIEVFSALFLIGGLLGLYIEFKTPGFGLPGILGILLLGVWFWGYHVAGLAGMGEILIFLLGVSLLLLEILVIPGFGVPGVAGITLIVISLLMAMVEHYPGGPWYVPPPFQVEQAVLTLSIALIVAFVCVAILARFLPQNRFFQRLTLNTAFSADQGYRVSATAASLVGRRGVAVTPLRPSGIGLFDGRRVAVVTRGTFVDAGSGIVVAEAHGNRIVVDRVAETV